MVSWETRILNMHFTLKQNPLRFEHLADFIVAFRAEARHERQESERFHSFTYEELLQRDKVSMDITWLRDASLEDSENLPPPGVIAAEIVEDLQAALDQFAEIAADLGLNGPERSDVDADPVGSAEA